MTLTYDITVMGFAFLTIGLICLVSLLANRVAPYRTRWVISAAFMVAGVVQLIIGSTVR